MALFRRSPSVEETVSGTLNHALGRILDAQAKQIEAMGSFLEKMTDLSMKRAASALGQRSAQVRARKRGEAKARQEFKECRLCRNPNITNPQVSEILAHNAHEALDQPEQVEVKADSEP